MEGGFFLDVVIGQRSTILELLASEDQALLVGRDPTRKMIKKSPRQNDGLDVPFLVLNFRLDIVDCIGRLDFKCDSFTREAVDRRAMSAREGKQNFFRQTFLRRFASC